MRSYSFLLLASAALLVRLGNAQTPAPGPPQDRNAASQRSLGTSETPSAILARNSKAIAVIVAANAKSAKLGTGFFVGKQGLLLTNFHVVEGTTTVGIKLSGNGAVTLITKVRGYDLDNDLAVLQVDGVDTQPVTLGDSDKVAAGQPVVVVGNPEGLEQTVSNGLVSAVRELHGRRLFQISAPISAGSSGSPVFNDHGEVIGVVVSSIQAGQNLNFAVPINYAKTLLKGSTEQLISSLPKRNGVEVQVQPPQSATPSEGGPTLAETLEWLVEKVGGAGYYSCHDEGKTSVCNREHYESVDAVDCKLSFTAVFDLVGRRTFSTNSENTISLRAVSPDISVDSMTLSYPCGSVLPQINQDTKNGCGKDFGDREIFRVGRPGVAGVFFRSKDMADRVAKAMNHAIALCGNEPF